MPFPSRLVGRFGNTVLPRSLTRCFGFSRRPLQFCSDQLWVKTAVLSGCFWEQWWLRDWLLELWQGTDVDRTWQEHALLSQSFGTHYQALSKGDKRVWWAGPGLTMTKTEERTENFLKIICRNLHRNVSSFVSFMQVVYQFPHRGVNRVFQDMESWSSVHLAAALVSDQSLHLDACINS